MALARLSTAYMLSGPVARRDRKSMGSLEGFTEQMRPEEMQVPYYAAARSRSLLAPESGSS